jgi:hypothetical protein
VKRWTILLGRGGTILVVIGCAVLLVSLIPSATIGTLKGSGGLEGKTWGIRYETILTPQQSLNINITANNTLKIYLLEVSYQTIYEWINETYPLNLTLPQPQNSGIELIYNWNETYLIGFLEFLKANQQNAIPIEKEISGDVTTSLEYTPTKMTNITLILRNPNPDFVEVNYEGSISLIMAPKAKMQTISQITIPVGFVLALPWIINFLKTKKEKSATQNTS